MPLGKTSENDVSTLNKDSEFFPFFKKYATDLATTQSKARETGVSRGEFYDLFDTFIKYGYRGSTELHWDGRVGVCWRR